MAAPPPIPPPLPTFDIPDALDNLIDEDSFTVIADYLKSELVGEENSRDSLCDFTRFKNKVITYIKPIAQSGPNCGIAALAMVASLCPSKHTVEEIFSAAKSRGYTNNGEMFSVENMTLLAESVVLPWYRPEMFSNGLFCNKSYVVGCLFSGALMLIPYDADSNHAPCCKKGHKAHWALVCGVLTDEIDQVSVAVRHGKSRRLAVWSLDELQRSNDNLETLDPVRAEDGRTYVLPKGGVKAGLASQFILLHLDQQLTRRVKTHEEVSIDGS